jgi:hypothetical protein
MEQPAWRSGPAWFVTRLVGGIAFVLGLFRFSVLCFMTHSLLPDAALFVETVQEHKFDFHKFVSFRVEELCVRLAMCASSVMRQETNHSHCTF